MYGIKLKNHKKTKLFSMNTIHQQLLDLYVSKDELRMWLNNPFSANGKTIASDANSLIAIPEFDESLPNYDDKIKAIYPFVENCNYNISALEIKAAIDKWDMFDCYDETTKKCDACDGDGEVTFTFEHGRREFEIEEDCPICLGEGEITTTSKTPNGQKEYNPSKYVKIGNAIFGYLTIPKLHQALTILNAEYFTLVKYTTAAHLIAIRVADVEIVIMPVTSADEENLIYTINL